PSEFALIDLIRQRVKPRSDVVLGIGDDAALLSVPNDQLLVVSTDTLNSGVHFPEDTAAQDIGYKALAVNLSDLAAMGATPAWASLAISLPDTDVEWLERFLDGFFELADDYSVQVIGGDTTQGPLSITVTIHGFVPKDLALRRDAAKLGDEIWVTGSIGDAAGGLAQWRARGLQSAKLRYRLDRPTPRVNVGIALRSIANAAIDISDGLLADLTHILQASHLGAEIEVCRVPMSKPLLDHFPDDHQRYRLQLTGGDDYELCFTAPAHQSLAIEQALAECDVVGTVIGHIVDGSSLKCFDENGELFDVLKKGFEHFSQAIN
ncbi:MAG: thiamine-phosphate kinase, partial [Arenimonas sp.]